MRKTGVWGRRDQPPQGAAATSDDHPVGKTLAFGAVVELLWALGLLVMLGVVSVVLWAALNTIGKI